MKIYLQNLVKELKQYSESLDKQSILINKPWALVDSDLGIQKLIFRRDNQLIMSKDGQVTTGRWEYLAEAKCLLIDRGVDKILCNENYIDDSILVLKIDGKSENFIVLANENNIPDLDAYKYLFKVLAEKANLELALLKDDNYLQFKQDYTQNILGKGTKALINFNKAIDGEYISKDETQRFIIRNNEIDSIKYLNKFYINDKDIIVIETIKKNDIKIGCKVTKNNQHIDNDEFIIFDGIVRIYVADSFITNIIHLKKYKLKNETNIIIEQKYEFAFKLGDAVYLNDNIAPDGKYNIKNEGDIKIKEGIIVKIGLSDDSKVLLFIISFFLSLIIISIAIALIFS
jgi:hypothetical protein